MLAQAKMLKFNWESTRHISIFHKSETEKIKLGNAIFQWCATLNSYLTRSSANEKNS